MEKEIAACKVIDSCIYAYNPSGKCLCIIPILPGETFQGWTSSSISKRTSGGQIYIYDCDGHCTAIC